MHIPCNQMRSITVEQSASTLASPYLNRPAVLPFFSSPHDIRHKIVNQLVLHGTNRKASWRDVEGLAMASKACRALVMDVWCKSFEVRSDEDWPYFEQNPSLFDIVRCIPVSTVDIHLFLIKLWEQEHSHS